MSQATQRPEALWSQTSPTPSVVAYFGTHRGEFNTRWIQSGYPHKGKASASFRLVTKIDEWDDTERFEGKGNGCWALRPDRGLNTMTADLLAAADTLGGQSETKSYSAAPGGMGADSGTVWVALLDGGVGVDVALRQHQSTNRLQVRQHTTIRGPRAYRALLELLGFDWIKRKLTGEQVKPNHEEFIQLVNELLAKRAP